MKLKGIIDKYGDDIFRDIEGEVNASLDVRNSVIAPGGSVIYSEYAMEHFKEIGTIVYLEVSYEDIARRLGDLRARGITFKEGQTLRDLYDERKPYYEKYADITCSENGRSISKVVEDICQKYELLREK